MKNSSGFPFFSMLFLLLFFGLGFSVTGILNEYLTKPQTINSKAAGPQQDPLCSNQGGECQSGFSGDRSKDNGASCTLSNGSKGHAIIGACPQQPETVRCCVADSTPQTQKALAGLTVSLQGIGPNAKIVDQQRTATIKLFDTSKPFEKATYSATDNLTYDSASGNFINPTFDLGNVAPAEYQMVIQIDTYLDEQLKTPEGGAVFDITGANNLQIADAHMRSGDVAPSPHGDNYVNIIDYNAVIGCMDGAPPGSCLNKKYADLNNDGVVDQKDLDILLGNFGEVGFAFQTDQFKCEPDPTCNSGKDSLQLCSLVCTRKTNRS